MLIEPTNVDLITDLLHIVRQQSFDSGIMQEVCRHLGYEVLAEVLAS